MFTLAAQLTLTDLFKFWFNNIWNPLVQWVVVTFNVSIPLANVILLLVIISICSAVNDSRKKNLVKQAMKESQK